VAALLIVAGTVWGLAFAPADYQQGNSFRIIYIHVPAAFLAQSAFISMASAGLVFMVWKIKVADMAATVMAPFGAAMTFVALFSGAVWGVPTWGTWWMWDARLTSMLILLFLYLGVIALRGAFSSRDSGSRAASVLAMVGVINIPIIKYSVDWWYTLHQPATFSVTSTPSMPMTMWLPLLVMVLGFYSFFIALTLMRTRSEILRREGSKRWVRELFQEAR
jgi:heme exporter protein C